MPILKNATRCDLDICNSCVQPEVLSAGDLVPPLPACSACRGNRQRSAGLHSTRFASFSMGNLVHQSEVAQDEPKKPTACEVDLMTDKHVIRTQ